MSVQSPSVDPAHKKHGRWIVLVEAIPALVVEQFNLAIVHLCRPSCIQYEVNGTTIDHCSPMRLFGQFTRVACSLDSATVSALESSGAEETEEPKGVEQRKSGLTCYPSHKTPCSSGPPKVPTSSSIHKHYSTHLSRAHLPGQWSRPVPSRPLGCHHQT